MNKQVLEDAMIRSGWPQVWEDQLDGLWSKIKYLSPKREFQRLLLNVKIPMTRATWSLLFLR